MAKGTVDVASLCIHRIDRLVLETMYEWLLPACKCVHLINRTPLVNKVYILFQPLPFPQNPTISIRVRLSYRFSPSTGLSLNWNQVSIFLTALATVLKHCIYRSDSGIVNFAGPPSSPSSISSALPQPFARLNSLRSSANFISYFRCAACISLS